MAMSVCSNAITHHSSAAYFKSPQPFISLDYLAASQAGRQDVSWKINPNELCGRSALSGETRSDGGSTLSINPCLGSAHLENIRLLENCVCAFFPIFKPASLLNPQYSMYKYIFIVCECSSWKPSQNDHYYEPLNNRHNMQDFPGKWLVWLEQDLL